MFFKPVFVEFSGWAWTFKFSRQIDLRRWINLITEKVTVCFHMTNVLKVLVNTIKEVGSSITLLIKIYILIDRYTATVSSTEVTYFFTREVPSSCTESSNCRLRKCERRPSILCGRTEIFSFSFLSGILLHKYSQKSSKVQNTMINYFVCNAKFRTCVCVL